MSNWFDLLVGTALGGFIGYLTALYFARGSSWELKNEAEDCGDSTRS